MKEERRARALIGAGLNVFGLSEEAFLQHSAVGIDHAHNLQGPLFLNRGADQEAGR